MRHWIRRLGSLRLTTVLLAFSILLVFFGTLDQVHYGIFETKRRYFESVLAFWHYPSAWVGGEFLDWLAIPLPGGYLLGFLLLVNLVCAHCLYFQARWKKVGIALIHGGVVVLIIGGFATSALQKESAMWLRMGEMAQYSEDFEASELVILDTTNPEFDEVTSFGSERVRPGKVIESEYLPFVIKPIEYHVNADLGLLAQNPDARPSGADSGAAAKMGLTLFPKTPVYEQNTRNANTAVVAIEGLAGEDLGTWLVSTVIDERFPAQEFEYEGRTYEIALRPLRYYYPFELELVEFKSEYHPGTEVPAYFSSKVVLHENDGSAGRPFLIYMNNPLRYGGYTFYQASFAEQGAASMLQVVRNEGRLIPYIATVMIALGLIWQFSVRLGGFLGRKKD